MFVQKFAKQLDKDHLKTDLIGMFQALALDEQDSVRLLAVENCAIIGTMLSPEESTQLVLPTIRACAQDKSWRVRYMVADHFCDVCGSSS